MAWQKHYWVTKFSNDGWRHSFCLKCGEEFDDKYREGNVVMNREKEGLSESCDQREWLKKLSKKEHINTMTSDGSYGHFTRGCDACCAINQLKKLGLYEW